ncbi:hypothetical protein AMS68_006294 [Peltaster fructicola]|uniref:Uncharacterized protein n=1 Tax=Peltaster fructicola TaxID=286661 RepID=A0A6H0Y189_9PEZI|nr:hypothetical protein AMS68_006294 [Peltaster fructicola]
MNLRKTPASSMQKTYDECYLTCSTAVYFEGQNNEAEALRAWRNALDQIYYHNAYKIPSSYTPRTETEKALQDSLRSMELQCKERVDLLEALKKSRDEASDETKPASTTNGNNHKGRESLLSGSRSPMPDEKKTWLGNDTVPQASYEDLPRPPPRKLTSRPSHDSRPSYGARKISSQDTSRTMSLPHVESAAAFSPSLAPPMQDRPRPSRTPSPEKKGGMLRTLRSNSGKDRASSGRMPTSMRSKAQPAAAKAATQVWAGQRQSLGAAEQIHTTSSSQGNTWDPYTRSLVDSALADQRQNPETTIRQPTPTELVRPTPKDRPSSRLSQASTVPRTEQSYLQAYRPNLTTTKQSEQSTFEPPPVPPHTSTSRIVTP